MWKKTLGITMLALAAFSADKRAIFPPGIKPVGPYSPGILVGDFLYVSGQGARDASGRFPATPEEQVRVCLENVGAIAAAAGLTMDHVVYSQVYLHPSVPYEVMDRAWRNVFSQSPPARAVLGVRRMPIDTPVEINAVCLRDLSRKRVVTPPGFSPDASHSAGVIAGDRLYLSGVLGRDPKTGRIPQEPAAQVQLALDQMKTVLAAAGLDFRHMVFVNPYLTEKIPWGDMNEVYARHFEFGNTPARATIGVSFLPLGANIEFTGVAVMDLSRRRAVRPKNMAPSPTASPCVFAGDTLFCSAKSGFLPGPHSGIYAERVEDQVRQSLRNLLDGLEEAGLDFCHVVASIVYLDNIDDFVRMNGVYGKYFPAETPPTRTTVAPLKPAPRVRASDDRFPKLEEISVIAVR